MSNHNFHYPFSAYVAGILSYQQLGDALKSFLADYPQQANRCQQQALLLLVKKLIHQQQLEALQALIPPFNPAIITESKALPRVRIRSETSTKDAAVYPHSLRRTAQASPLPATRFVFQSSSQADPALIAPQTPPLLSTPSQNTPTAKSPSQTLPSQKTYPNSNHRYYSAGFLVFFVGCLSGYWAHDYQLTLMHYAKNGLSEQRTAQIQPDTTPVLKTTSTSSINTPENTGRISPLQSATAASIEDLINLQLLLPQLSLEPQKHYAAADALLQKLQSQYDQNTPEIQQARQTLAQAYLQLARDARQQQQWQKAEFFLANSIAMRINLVKSVDVEKNKLEPQPL